MVADAMFRDTEGKISWDGSGWVVRRRVNARTGEVAEVRL